MTTLRAGNHSAGQEVKLGMAKKLGVLLAVLIVGMYVQTAIAEDIYAPYNTCMRNCEEQYTNCNENIRTKDSEGEAKSDECSAAKASCIQECQYLPIPPEEVVPPPEEYRQKRERQLKEEEQARQKEEAQQKESSTDQQDTQAGN